MLHSARGIITFFHGVRKAAFDGTETHADIFPGSGQSGHGSGILIGKRIKDHLGKFLFQCIGNGIDKPQHRPGRRSLRLIHCRTFRTGTEGLIVHLGNGNDPAVRIFLKDPAYIFNGDLQDFRIGQTHLHQSRIFRNVPHTVPHGIIFRMLFAIFFQRQDPVQGMNKKRVFHISAELFRNIGTVDPQFQRKPLMRFDLPGIMMAVLKKRLHRFIPFR